jgi:acyl-CoA thioesterase-1
VIEPLLVVYMAASIAYLVFIIAIFKYIGTPPGNNPDRYLKRSVGPARKAAKKIVLLGDSITHGTVSVNYSKMLEQRLKQIDGGFDVINAGINGDLAYNALQRVDTVIKINPDYIMVLIGTNDAKAAFTPEDGRFYVKSKKLPVMPTLDWFRENLKALLAKLKRETRAKIGVLSIPTIGEDPTHPVFSQSKTYADAIKEIASDAGVAYLPLHEAQVAHLEKEPAHPRQSFKRNMLVMFLSILKHYHGMSWDRVAASNGFRLHIDFLHLNKRGATMVVDFIEAFVKVS